MHAIADYNPKLTPTFVQKLANLVFTLRETCFKGYHAGYTDDGHAGGISSASEEEYSKQDAILWDAMRQLANDVAFTIVNERVREASYRLGRRAGMRDGYIQVSYWLIRTISISKGVITSSDRFPTLDDARRHAKNAIDAMADTDTTVQAIVIPVLPDGTMGGIWETMRLGQC